MENDYCLICDRISWIKDGRNPYFVAELETGYVVIGDFQYFTGYTLFLCKEHKTELHFLQRDFKINFLNEMSLVSEAVYNAFKPIKMNCDCLGNSDSHVHWHIFPRYGTDPCPKNPVFEIDKKLMYCDEVRPTPEQLENTKHKLLVELKKLTTVIS